VSAQNAARDYMQDVVGRADAHQVSRPISGLLDHRQHHLLRLADSEPVETDVHELPGDARSQM